MTFFMPKPVSTSLWFRTRSTPLCELDSSPSAASSAEALDPACGSEQDQLHSANLTHLPQLLPQQRHWTQPAECHPLHEECAFRTPRTCSYRPTSWGRCRKTARHRRKHPCRSSC